MQNKEKKFSLHNFVEKQEDENEDSINFKGFNQSCFKLGLSDGAGGAGIYCRDWSRKLVNSQPDFNQVKADFDWNEWYINLCRKFFDEINSILPEDIFIREKFTNIGSFATMLYLWREGNIIYYLGSGDTTFFLFKKTNGKYIPKVIYPINNQKSIDSNPYLLNWNESFSTLDIQHIDLEENDVIICATDSIARWIIQHLYVISDCFEVSNLLPYNFLSNELLEDFKLKTAINSSNELISKLLEINSEKEFDFFLRTEIERHLMVPDDFTLFTYKV